ncbi:MAG: NUDIX domain-containing protein [Hyphomicrobiales bacterium]|nr:NUDIX domain-containing protein [Hyphomicrobiales bacterium]
MAGKWIATKILFPYWRLTRGMTLGAQGVVIDGGGRVLLIRHGYRPGWHFPGGGVDWRETVEAAMRREVFEETGVIVEGSPVLHGFFANFQTAPSDHIAVFIVRDWRQPAVPPPNREITEQRFFDPASPSDDISPGARRRLAELFGKTPVSQVW